MSEHFEHSRAGDVDLFSGDTELLCPQAVQPHGVLLALDGPDMIVTRVSDNVEELLGVSCQELLGRPIGLVLQGVDLQMVCRCARETHDDAIDRRIDLIDLSVSLAVNMRDRVRKLNGSVHRSGRFVVLELEPSEPQAEPSFADVYRRIRNVVARLQKQERVVDMCALVAEEIRVMLGFDRVVLWRFDEEGQDEVVVEQRGDDARPFPGMRCPTLGGGEARQWRASYLRNRVRHVPDATRRPAALVSSCDPAHEGVPLDMTCASLRSVSPLQGAYMRTMGIRASMCVALVVQGKLWGVISCQHGGPKLVSYELRACCELLGQALSWQIAAVEQAESHEQASRARAHNARLIERVSGRARYRDGLLEEAKDLLGIVNARGAAVFCNGDCEVMGDVPPAEDIARIVAWVVRHMTEEVFSTRCLGGAYTDATGLLAIRLPDSPASFVLWFRPAAHPARYVDIVPDHGAVSGRWQRPAQAKAPPWQPWEIEVASELREAIVGSLSRRSDDLARANEELRAASLLRDEFLSTLSHELRTPLNAIIGWAHMLQNGDLPQERRAHASQVILRNAHMQTRLVDDLLDISRIVRGNLRLKAEAVNLAEVIEAAVRSIETAAAAKSLTIETTLDLHAGPIAGDPGRLQQVVWNLLSNAIKYTPTGGRVQVGLRRKPSSVEITVVDSGVGILPADLPHVFERFQRGQVGASRGGLGLGLAIVRSLVELHGGTVEATSGGKGCGARFVVRLPLSPLSHDKKNESKEDRPRPRRPAHNRKPSLSGLCILVVEDDEDSKELLAAVLRDRGATVTAVDSGTRALTALVALAEGDGAMPDIIISDIGMPGMDGYELIRRVRQLPEERGGRVPAIALTAYVRAQDRSRAFLAGYQAHAPKPLDIGKLMSLVLGLTGRAVNS